MMAAQAFAKELVVAAQEGRAVSQVACIPQTPPKPVFMQFKGWTFGLDVLEHPSPLGDRMVLHYQMSAKLYPQGRSSDVHDWQKLGEVVASVMSETYTGEIDRSSWAEPVLPIKDTHPNSAIMWLWHGDGSAVHEKVVETIKATLLKIQEAYKARATQPHLAESEKVGRNEDCPCGSGKKFKKCHGAN